MPWLGRVLFSGVLNFPGPGHIRNAGGDLQRITIFIACASPRSDQISFALASVLSRHGRFLALLFRLHRIQHVVIETMAAIVVMFPKIEIKIGALGQP